VAERGQRGQQQLDAVFQHMDRLKDVLLGQPGGRDAALQPSLVPHVTATLSEAIKGLSQLGMMLGAASSGDHAAGLQPHQAVHVPTSVTAQQQPHGFGGGTQADALEQVCSSTQGGFEGCARSPECSVLRPLLRPHVPAEAPNAAQPVSFMLRPAPTQAHLRRSLAASQAEALVLRGDLVQLQASLDRSARVNDLLQAEVQQLKERWDAAPDALIMCACLRPDSSGSCSCFHAVPIPAVPIPAAGPLPPGRRADADAHGAPANAGWPSMATRRRTSTRTSRSCAQRAWPPRPRPRGSRRAWARCSAGWRSSMAGTGRCCSSWRRGSRSWGRGSGSWPRRWPHTPSCRCEAAGALLCSGCSAAGEAACGLEWDGHGALGWRAMAERLNCGRTPRRPPPTCYPTHVAPS
jgi:hypothetical protein